MRAAARANQRSPAKFPQIIHEQNEVIRRVYFPVSGIIWLLLAVEERSLLEVGIVGSEGFVGLSLFHSVRGSNNRAIGQDDGAVLEIDAADFAACETGEMLPLLLV